MEKFEFEFNYRGYHYAAECQRFPLDGSSELHVTPLDTDMFETFGVRIMQLQADGSISTEVPAPAEERDYILALADGVAAYYNNPQQRSN
jgi:hypothetical protein